MKLATIPWEYVIPPPKSVMTLDNLGLTISLKMLEGWPEYQTAKIAVFGKGRLRRWWMRHVFPRIRTREYERRVAVFKEKQAQMRQELMNAVIERGKGRRSE